MSREQWLAFTPRDTVAVRDGRPFRAGVDFVAESVPPWPSTIAGAVRAAYGDREPQAVRGPVLARFTDTGGWNLHFPMPADVVRSPGGRAYLLRPDPELAGIITDLGEGLLAPARKGKVEPAEGWIPASALTTYLHAKVSPGGFDLRKELRPYRQGADPLVPERRVGLARTRARTAREGYFYQSVHLRPRENWAFLACCDLPSDAEEPLWRPRNVAQLGGGSRLADVTEADGVDWPKPPAAFPGGRVLAYLATPALWRDGWRPPLPQGAELVGAAVPAPRPVASSSPRTARERRTKLLDTVSLRWAVPAGAVYLLRFEDLSRAAEWAGRQHARPWGPPAAERLDTAGFGVVLIGTWKEPHS